MIVLDASVLIAHFDGADAHHSRARRLLSEGLSDVLRASPITLAEFLVTGTRAGVQGAMLDGLSSLGVSTEHLPVDAPARLADLRVRTGLKMPACCVVLAAQTSTGAVATFDDRLASAARSLGLDTRG